MPDLGRAATRRIPRGDRIRLDRRALLITAVLGSLIAFLCLRAVAGFWTDYLWYDDLGHADTWGRVISAKLTLGLAGTVAVFVVISAALLVAQRSAPDSLIVDRSDPLLALRALFAARPNLIRTAFALLGSLLAGPQAASSWQSWTLFRYGSEASLGTGQSAPEDYLLFGKSLGFYLFRLPFLRSLTSWLFAVAVMVFILTLVTLVLNGSIRRDLVGVVVAPGARRLLGVLLAFIFLTRALGFWYARFALTLSRHPHFDGASYVDLHVRAPALILMALVSVVCAVAMLVAARRSDIALAIGTFIAWVLTALVALVVVPKIWERIALSNEVERERPSIERSIAATRASFDLGEGAVTTRTLAAVGPTETVDDTLRPASQGLDVVRSLIRVWDTRSDAAPDAFNSLQKQFENFQIAEVDADRTVSSGKVVPRLIAVRETASGGQSPSWVNRTMTFTHGYAVVTADANAADTSGAPRFVARDLPPVGEPRLDQPRVYFGEATRTDVVVDTNVTELDFGGTEKRPAPPYDADQGVGVGSIMRRAAFALRFADLNYVLSDAFTSKSRLLWRRQITERARKIAPFLRFDSDPLPIVYKGRVLWVIEAYTVSSSFPNADRTYTYEGASGGPAETLSYARNAVRVVIDSYSGETSLFRIDERDPIAAAFDAAYPLLFEPAGVEERYPGLSALVRYPRDLFSIRAALWGRYHIDGARDFYNESDRWVVGSSLAGLQADPNDSVVGSQVGSHAAAWTGSANAAPATPMQYVVGDPEGKGSAQFLALQTLVNRQARPEHERLRAMVTASSAPKEYGKLTVLRPSSSTLDSPYSAATALKSSPIVSYNETNLGRGGSEVVSGEVQIAVLEGRLVYVRPLYVRSQSSKLPLLRYVEVRYGERTGFAPTLDEALRQAVSGSGASLAASVPGEISVAGEIAPSTPPTPTTRPAAATPGASSDAELEAMTTNELLGRAASLLDEAKRKLAAGDLGGYQRSIDEAARAVRVADARENPTAEQTAAIADSPSTTVPGSSSTVAGSGASTTVAA